MSLSKQTPITQNYEFHDSVSDASYNYYLYIDRKGSVLVIRTTLSNDEARYSVGVADDYATILTNVANLNYKKINEFGG